MSRSSILTRAAWLVLVAGLVLGASWAQPAFAQSCPGGYAACDNGGCCLSSDQCCPTLDEGCCSPVTPFCCGDGTCAAAPSECGNVARNTCTDYDVPCGGGCAPAGSQCCDLAGHYCPPQGVCTSETQCVAGEEVSSALQILASAAPPVQTTRDPEISPLVDPPNGTTRSCAFTARGNGSGVAPVLLLLSCLVRRRTRVHPRLG